MWFFFQGSPYISVLSVYITNSGAAAVINKDVFSAGLPDEETILSV